MKKLILLLFFLPAVCFSQTKPSWLQLKNKPAIDVREYGAISGDTTDDSTAIQMALDAADKQEVDLTDGKFVCNSTLTVNVSKARLIGRYAELDFSGLASGTQAAIVVTGDADLSTNPYFQAPAILSGFLVLGNTPHGSTIGMMFDSSAEPGSSHIAIRDVGLYGFGYGMYFKDNAYAIEVDHCDIWDCNIGIYTPQASSVVNGGERLSFRGCTIFNCSTAGFSINNSNSTWFLTNCSIDYNGCQLYLTDGTVSLSNCHIEFRDIDDGIIQDAGVSAPNFLTLSGCTIVCQNTAASDATPIIQVNSANYFNMFGGVVFVGASEKAPVYYSDTGSRFKLIGTHNSYLGTQTYDLNGIYEWLDAQSPFIEVSRPIFSKSYIETEVSYFRGSGEVSIVATSTYTPINNSAYNGLYVFRDETLGGTAAFLFDTSYGATALATPTISGISMQYNAVAEKAEVQVDGAPRTLSFSIFGL